MEYSDEDYRDLLNELLDVDHGLSDWEMDFLDSLINWAGSFTAKQKAVLERVYNQHC